MKNILSLFVILFSITLALAGCGSGLGSKELDLSEAYSVSYQGDNQEGSIQISVDEEKLLDQLNPTEKVKQDMVLLAKIKRFFESIHFEAMPGTNLENGQKVSLVCKWDEELAKELKIKPVLKESDFVIPEDTFRVIQKLTEEDVFGDVSVQVTGGYPQIVAEAKYSFPNRITENINLSIDKVDWKNQTAIVRAEMEEAIAEQLSVSLKPMTKELKVPGYYTYHIDWPAISLKDKEIMIAAGKKIIEKGLEEFIVDNYSDVFANTPSYENENLQKRAYKDVKLDNISFMQIREGARAQQYGGGLFSNYKDLYNRLILTYAVTVYDHIHTDGIVRYLPVMAHNVIVLENGDLSYDFGEIELKDSYVRDNPLDHKGKYIDDHAAQYEIFTYTAQELLK
ncbi:MAG: hypothetical protein Q4A29_09095 [Eubacteriales bacterium]|nr:hypothetical protein [Eubacteriales bacterium]